MLGRTRRQIWVGNKESLGALHAPIGSSSSFQGDDSNSFNVHNFIHKRKGGKIRFQKLLKHLTPHCLKNALLFHTALTRNPILPGSFSVEWGFLPLFLISESCGTFNRLHHFGVAFSRGGPLRCNYILWGMMWHEGCRRRLLNHKNTFPIQKK